MKSEAYEADRLAEAARDHSIDLQIVNPREIGIIARRDAARTVRRAGQFVPLPDVVLPRMGAHTTDRALAVMRHLEERDVPFVNGSLSVEVCADKFRTHSVLASHLPVPPTLLADTQVDPDVVEEELGFPVIMKSMAGSQGAGVLRVESRKVFCDLLEFYCAAGQEDARFILQKYIVFSEGRDLRVFVVGGRCIACMQRTATNGDFKANLSRGGAATPFPITPEIEWIATQSARLLQLDVAGVDLLFGEDGFVVCEVNSSPGWQGLEQCYPNLNIAEGIVCLVKNKLRRTTLIRR